MNKLNTIRNLNSLKLRAGLIAEMAELVDALDSKSSET